MKLILIHGRAQEGKDADVLKEQWVTTWAEGLEKNQLSIPQDIEVVFPYYGDLLFQQVEKYRNSGDMKDIIERGTIQNEDAAFFHDFLFELSINAGITEQELLEHFHGNSIQRGPLNWEWVQSILRALDKTPAGRLSLKAFTYDVFVYCTSSGIRREINKYVSNSLNSEPSVVVAHSLGSVVAYNILRENTSGSVSKFITVGSPLGVRSVNNHLLTPICMPGCVKNGWFNAYDNRDVVALRALDNTVFAIHPAIENYGNVDNHTDNRHGIEGYLNDEIVAKTIYDALTA